MIKRIEFSLNLEDPQEAKIYRALLPALRYRRAGAVIRQALGAQLVEDELRTKHFGVVNTAEEPREQNQ